MPDKIVYSQDEIDRIYQKLNRLSGTLSQISGELRSIRMSSAGGADYAVHGCGIGRLSGFSGANLVRAGSVQDAVANYASVLDRYSEHTRRLGSQVLNASGAFISCEQKLCDITASAAVSIQLGAAGASDQVLAAIAGVLHFPSDKSTWTVDMYDQYMKLISESTLLRDADGNLILANGDITYFFDKNGSLRREVTAKEEFGELSYVIKTYDQNGGYTKEEAKLETKLPQATYKHDIDDEDKFWHKESGANGAYKDGKKLSEEEAKRLRSVKQIGTLFGIGTSYSASCAYKENQYAYKSDHLEMEGTLSALKGDFSASWQAGLYAYKVDKDGKTHRTLSPSVSAEIGGSVSLLSADGSITNDFGFFKNKITGSVEVGQAEMKGNVAIGIIDGKVNASAGVSAEANLVKVGVSDTISLGPVDVEGSAALTVGIGGHAKVGIDDGVLTIDIGASFGVGFETKVSIDTSGIVEGIGDAVDGIKEAAGFVGNCVQGASKAVSDFWNSLF